MSEKSEKIIIMHGFEKPEILQLMRVVKENFQGEELIFASTTPTSLTWKVQDLIEELKSEHEEFKKIKAAKLQNNHSNNQNESEK
ncbi:DUF3783 domain-containing protein [Fervidobacterium gondwanense]|uniref:DUF3783 domain-containing protein n=1 Tax=Fervidobacterium gondwanense DSM 13020 TaxID=1121883 RepID=A0A1M7SJT1_FERGO|nr:DUF3783 domain-containing protein [Fervidobacterium gondwanense]SHN58678.1 protein of unknown function [Fervidobacterium gondwanense DSM 13020]